MTAAVMRYVASSRNGRGPLLAMASDLPNMIVTRNAAMPLEYGVKGEELMRELKKGMEKFIRAMELQGLTLIPLPEGNPLVVTHKDGRPYATYSVTKDLARSQPDELIDHQTEGAGPSTFRQPRSLEDSHGLVDYRFVGVFWAPQVSMEIAVERDRLLAGEKAAKNPRQWGAGQSTPTRSSDSGGSGLVVAKR